MPKRHINISQYSPKIFAFIGAAVLFLILVGWIIRLLITQPKLELSPQQRVNFVWQDPAATRIISLVPGQALLILEFPQNAAITATRGYGEYPLSSLWKLAQLDNRPDLVTESLQQFVALPVSGWFSQNIRCDYQDNAQLKSCLLRSLNPLRRPSGNLSLIDQLRLFRYISQIKLAQTELISLGHLRAATEKTLPDGQILTIFNQEILDSDLSQRFYSPDIVTEDLQIEIINTTGYPGLANQAARLANHLGVRVVSAADNDQKLTSCIIKTTPDKNASVTIRRLQQIFKCNLDLNLSPDFPYDLQLLLGNDYQQLWQGK